MIRADLHAHTTASDGQLSPEALVRLAVQLQLEVIAITDHDTTAGIAPAQWAARDQITIIPAIELGARRDDQKVDVLGYFIDARHPGFQQRLETFQHNRVQRGHLMIRRLADLGLPLDWVQVTALAGGDNIGRPHVARALVAAGYVADTREAFERYIGRSGPAYVARETLSPEEAIDLIHQAGGAAVLAHPIYVPDFPDVVEQLVPAGLDGIEVAYPAHSSEIETRARELADAQHLVMTGGSDFHGLDVSGKAMLGSVLAPPGCVEALRERAAQWPTSRSSPARGSTGT